MRPFQRSFARTAASLFFLGSLQCGSGGGHPLVASDDAWVTLRGAEGKTRAPRMNGSDPRIQAAGHAIVEQLGHRLEFEVDAAVAAQFPSIEDAIVTAMETTAQAIHVQQQRAKEAYSFTKSHLRKMSFVYTPLAERDPPRFDANEGTLTISVNPQASELIPGYALSDAVESASDEHAFTLYERARAGSVNPAEQGAFFAYWSNGRARHLRAKHPSSAEREQNDRVSLLRIAELYPLASDSNLRQEMRTWLLRAGEKLGHFRSPSEVEPMREAELSWVNWANNSLSHFNDRERVTLAELVLERGQGWDDSPEVPRPMFDSFKVLEFARPIIQNWIESEHGESNESRDGSARRLYDLVLCPFSEERDGDLSRPGSCRGGLYRDLLGTSAKTPSRQPRRDGTEQLAELISTFHDRRFTQTTSLYAFCFGGASGFGNLLRRIETDEAASLLALRALARLSEPNQCLRLGERQGSGSVSRRGDHLPAEQTQAIVSEVAAWWKTHPSRRGMILYLLTRLGRSTEGIVPWNNLAAFFGAPLSPSEFGSFLDQGDDTLRSLRLIRSGLGKDWPRSKELLPRFGQWLDQKAAHDSSGPDAHYMAERLIEALCDDERLADIADVKHYLEARVVSHPSEEHNLESFAKAPVASLCTVRARAAHQKAHTKQEILFGD